MELPVIDDSGNVTASRLVQQLSGLYIKKWQELFYFSCLIPISGTDRNWVPTW